MNPLEMMAQQGGMPQPSGNPLEQMQPQQPMQQGGQSGGLSDEELAMIEEIMTILQQMSPEELEKAMAENPQLEQFVKALQEAEMMATNQGGGMEQPEQPPMPMQGGMM